MRIIKKLLNSLNFFIKPFILMLNLNLEVVLHNNKYQSNKLYLTIHLIALKPSFHVIFFPSEYFLP